MPTAPWAKLKTPDVVYVTTRPVAAMAYPAPNMMPNTLYCRKLLTESIPFPVGPHQTAPVPLTPLRISVASHTNNRTGIRWSGY